MPGVGGQFDMQGEFFNVKRDGFATLEEMNTYPDTSVPHGFVSYCQETGNRYQYFKGAIYGLENKWIRLIDIREVEYNDIDDVRIGGIYYVVDSASPGGNEGSTLIVAQYRDEKCGQFFFRHENLKYRTYKTDNGYDWYWTEWEIGGNGKSAYEIALDNGFAGNENAWLDSLKGPTGARGATGAPGQDGSPGKSAYDIAVSNGFTGSQADWLLSLKGEKGDPGTCSDGTPGTGEGLTEAQKTFLGVSGDLQTESKVSLPSAINEVKEEVGKVWNKVGNTMTIDQKVTYDKISSGIYGIGVTALGSGTIKINNVNRDLSAGYNELLIDGIFAIESLASDKNILSIDWITTNADITRLAFNGAELLNRLNISFCVFNSVNMQINAKSLTEINFDTCIFKGISSLRFSTCDSLYSAKINAKIKVNTLQNFFMGRNYLLKDLCISNFDTSDCTSFQYAFFRLDKLERLDLSGIDTSKVNHYGAAFDGSNMQLKDFLAPKPNTCKATVSFGQCPNLTVGATYSKPSVDSIIDWLYDYVAKGETTTNTITFHSTVKNALSQTQTDAITNKGWTIA